MLVWRRRAEELDELEKEEIFRTKKVIEVKRIKEAIETKDRLARAKARGYEEKENDNDMLNQFSSQKLDEEDDLF